ncbi:hypothetical protein L249_8508, partial [Ophiocordyceps polyrhachis-furcata BCC 54312]
MSVYISKEEEGRTTTTTTISKNKNMVTGNPLDSKKDDELVSSEREGSCAPDPRGLIARLKKKRGLIPA